MPDTSLRSLLERLLSDANAAPVAALPPATEARPPAGGGEMTRWLAEALTGAKSNKKPAPVPPSIHAYDCPLPVDQMPIVSPDPGDAGIELTPPDVDPRMKIFRRPIPPFGPYLHDSAGWHVEGCWPDGRKIWPGDRV